MDVLEVLTRVWVLSLVLFIHIMLAGGLAVTLQLMVTVSSRAGALLLPLIAKPLRGTDYPYIYGINSYHNYCTVHATH